MSEKTLSRSPSARMTASIRARSASESGSATRPSSLEIGEHARDLPVDRQGLHPLALDPEELVLVVAGRRAVHPVERELLDQLGAAEDLLAGVVAPAQPRQVVEQGLGQVAALDVLVKVDEHSLVLVFLDLPLRHLGLRSRLGHVGHVGEGGQRAPRASKTRSCGKVFERCSSARTTWVIRIVDVVDHAGEVVERRAVGADDHEVADLVGRERHVALDQVVEHQGPAQGNLEPEGEGAALRLVPRRADPASTAGGGTGRPASRARRRPSRRRAPVRCYSRGRRGRIRSAAATAAR